MIPQDARAIRLLLVDDHEIVRIGLREFFKAYDDVLIVGECDAASHVLAEAIHARPHVVLMNTHLPDGCGLQVCRDICAALPDTKVLFLTAINDTETRLESILAGADGCLQRNTGTEALIQAVRSVAVGCPILDPTILSSLLQIVRASGAASVRKKPPGPRSFKELSPQEHRIMSLVAEGKTNKEIGEVLTLSDKTVKNYLSNIYQKLHVTRRSQATALFMERIYSP